VSFFVYFWLDCELSLDNLHDNFVRTLEQFLHQNLCQSRSPIIESIIIYPKLSHLFLVLLRELNKAQDAEIVDFVVVFLPKQDQILGSSLVKSSHKKLGDFYRFWGFCDGRIYAPNHLGLNLIRNPNNILYRCLFFDPGLYNLLFFLFWGVLTVSREL